MFREGTSIEEGCLMARLITRKLISIRCDPPLPRNPPTPRRQVLSCTIVDVMQKIQQCKRLEEREGTEADRECRVEVKKGPREEAHYCV